MNLKNIIFSFVRKNDNVVNMVLITDEFIMYFVVPFFGYTLFD